jgi:hypothetical protein
MPAAALWPLTYYGHTCWQLGDRAIVDDVAPDEAHVDPEPVLPLDGVYDGGEDPAQVARDYEEAAVSAGLAVGLCTLNQVDP